MTNSSKSFIIEHWDKVLITVVVCLMIVSNLLFALIPELEPIMGFDIGLGRFERLGFATILILALAIIWRLVKNNTDLTRYVIDTHNLIRKARCDHQSTASK